MTTPNFASGTVWTGDCLEIMRGMNSETVDLIYLDPPFNSNANYAAPVGSAAAGAAFKDTWTLSDVDAEWINLIEQKHPAVHRVLLAAMTDSDKSYLAYMAARLLEMPRLLKPTGSIYLHCDPTMSHYLKLIMDAVFGRRNFKNEITWKRTSSRSDARRYGRIHDTLLFYVRGSEATWNGAWEPHDEEYVNRFYRHSDESGRRYMLDNMASPNPRPNMTYNWRGFPPPEKGWRFERETMQRLHDEGRIWYPPSTDRRPRLKRYLDEQKGRAAGDVIADINPISAHAKERMGYPTQKPLELLERVIKASSNEGDMVLDPFCGCATTLVAADRLNRQWVGIDLSAKAAELVLQRVEADQGLWKNIVHRTDLPARDDLGPLPAYNSTENRQKLYGEQAGDCAGCSEHFLLVNLTVDHIIARSKGGNDHIDNLQLLCGHCNSVKGVRGMEYLRTKLQLLSAG